MKPYLNVKFADGYIYEVPTIVIATDRANHFHANYKEEFPTFDDALKETVAVFDDTFEIEDWAKNNMNWEEIEPHSKIIGFEPPERSWFESEIEFVDEPTNLTPPSKEENLLSVPLIFALSRIALMNRFCSIVGLDAEDSSTVAAFVLIKGGPDVVDFYTKGLDRLTEVVQSVIEDEEQKVQISEEPTQPQHSE